MSERGVRVSGRLQHRPRSPRRVVRGAIGAVLLAAVVGGVPVGGAAAQSAYRDVLRFKAGNWLGYGFVARKSGLFSHCSMRARYRSGIHLYFVLTRKYRFLISFGKASWRLTPRRRYQVRYYIDRRLVHRGAAYVDSRTTNLVKAELPAKRWLIDSFRRGQVFTIRTAQGEASFRLTGTGLAFERMVNCVRTGSRRWGPRSDPFGGDRRARRRSNNSPFDRRDDGRRPNNNKNNPFGPNRPYIPPDSFSRPR